MAGRGPAPTGNHSRERDQRRADQALVSIAQDGELRGPELPEGVAWHPQTLAWWETWRSSPQAQMFTQTDWDFLTDTALLHTELWSGNASAAVELRLRTAKFGATPEDRARLKLQIQDEAEKAPKRKGSMTKDRRSRILKAVDGGAPAF